MAFCNVFAKFYFLIMAPPSPQRCLVWNLGVSFSKCCSAAKLQRDIGTSPVSTQSSCSHPWVSFGIASYGRCRDKRETVLKPARACIQGCVCVSLYIYVCVCVCVRVHVCISLLLCNDTVTADPGHSAIMADEQGSPGSGWSGWLLGGETLPRASAIIYPKSAASRHVAPDRELQYFICLPVNQPCVGADGNIVWSLSDTLIICSPLIDTFTQQSTLHQHTTAAISVCVYVWVCTCMRRRLAVWKVFTLVCVRLSGGHQYCQWPREGGKGMN